VLNAAAGVEYVQEETIMREKEVSDLEMLDCPPLVFKSVKKKKTMKIKEKLDDGFLRRSKRVSQKLGWFKTEKSTQKHEKTLQETVAEKKKNRKTAENQKNKRTIGTKKLMTREPGGGTHPFSQNPPGCCATSPQGST
jgi:hypothetical protein